MDGKQVIPAEEMPKAQYLLSRFDAISMREQQGVDVLKNKFSLQSCRVLDPVFLCDLNNWDIISNNSKLKIQEEYVFAYLMDPTAEKARQLKIFADRHSCKLITIPDRQNNYQEKAKILEQYGLIQNASLEDYLYCFKNAKYTITDSFHGMCFSIIYRKPFYAVINRDRGASRFEDLAKVFKLSDRLLEDMRELNVKPYRNDELDYSNSDRHIALEILKSKNWLYNQLISEKQFKSVNELIKLNYEIYSLRQQLKENK